MAINARPLNVAVDATCWQNMRGYGRHARALLLALAHLDHHNRYTFVVDSLAGTDTIPDHVEICHVPAAKPASQAASASGSRSPVDMLRVSQALSAPGYDVVFFPTVYTYTPVFSRARKLVMFHDLIAEKFPHYTFSGPLPRLLWTVKTRLGRWQADQILTVSEYSRGCLAEYFHIPAERIQVVGEASDPAFRRLHDCAAAWAASPRLAALNLNPSSQRLVVYVGGFGPHKNLEGLAGAFARLAADPQFSDARLVLVGEYRQEVFFSQSAELQAHIAGLGLGEKALFTGFLPDEDLAVLLNCAAVLALPSWMEGFGLPAVEAAACGCPVIATTASPLPGLLGAGGVYVDPGDDAALERALAQVLASPELRAAMGAAGAAAAAALTWEAAAEQLRAAIQAAA